MNGITVADTPRRRRLIAFALFAGTVLLFARAIPHEFVNYDDPDYVTANAHVQGGLSAESVRWAFGTSAISYWHPLTWLSHMLDWQLFGDKPAGHHATNVLWHAFNAALAFLTLRRLTGAVGTSAIAAALFAWHPLRVESVAWVAERKDVLSGFFWLLTLWAYAGYVERRASGLQTPRSAGLGTASARQTPYTYYIAALAAFAGGLMSKPMLVTLPAVLLVLDFWPLRRGEKEGWARLIVEKIPFAALSVAVSVVTIIAQKNVGTLSEVLPLDARLANAAVAVARYLGKFFLPLNLAVLYPHPGRWPTGAVVAAVAFMAGVSWLAWQQRVRRSWVLAGWAWFLVALLPVSGVVQVGIQSMADRYTYVPMLGVELALLWTIREAVTAPAARRVWAYAAVAGLAAGAARTWDQLGAWKNSYTLFDHAIAVKADGYLAFNNRGIALGEMGRTEESAADYRRSLQINADYADANNNLGRILTKQGRAAEAVPLLRAAVTAKPELIEAHNNLANALADLGQLDEAMEHYRFVLARQPQHVDAMNNLGIALAMKGDTAAAIAKFEEALRLNPNHANSHSNLGNVCAMLGRREEAIAHYRRALELAPKDAQTLNNLANVYGEAGRLEEAVDYYRRALALEPANHETEANLGFTLSKLGRRDEAIQHLQAALKLRPDYVKARAWLESVMAAPK